jgi:hypothetical protein
MRSASRSALWWTLAAGTVALVGGIMWGNSLAKKGGGCPVRR